MVYELKHSYIWADGYVPKVKAEVVGEVVERIVDRDGCVTRESFLNESRSKYSPTHCLFEWDDAKAAESYRLEQARLTISQLRISYEDDRTGENRVVKAYVNTNNVRGNATYENITVVLENEDKSKVLFEKMQKELDILIERNRNVEGLADVLISKGNELKNVG